MKDDNLTPGPMIPCLFCGGHILAKPNEATCADALSELFQTCASIMRWETNNPIKFDFANEPFPFCDLCRSQLIDMFELNQKIQAAQAALDKITANVATKILQNGDEPDKIKEDSIPDEDTLTSNRTERRILLSGRDYQQAKKQLREMTIKRFGPGPAVRSIPCKSVASPLSPLVIDLSDEEDFIPTEKRNRQNEFNKQTSLKESTPKRKTDDGHAKDYDADSDTSEIQLEIVSTYSIPNLGSNVSGTTRNSLKIYSRRNTSQGSKEHNDTSPVAENDLITQSQGSRAVANVIPNPTLAPRRGRPRKYSSTARKTDAAFPAKQKSNYKSIQKSIGTKNAKTAKLAVYRIGEDKFTCNNFEFILQNEKYKCQTCLWCSSSAYLMKYHILENHINVAENSTAERVDCPKCGQDFESSDHLHKHTKRHRIERMLTKSGLNRLLGTARSTSLCTSTASFTDFTCVFCTKVYRSEATLQNHLLQHKKSLEVNIKCDICGAEVHRTHFLKHINQIHKNVFPEIPCKFCDTKFRSKLSLNLHLQDIHTRGLSLPINDLESANVVVLHPDDYVSDPQLPANKKHSSLNKPIHEVGTLETWEKDDDNIVCSECSLNFEGSWIQCDKCDDWFHFGCVGISQTPSESVKWFCKKCKRSATSDDEYSPQV